MATHEALRNQARALARRYLKQRNSAPLNAVRAWIGTDRKRSQIFDEELDEALEGQSVITYEDTFPPSPVDPISLPTLSTEADDRHTPLQLLAFRWMCCMELQPTDECRKAWGAWVRENPQHHIEYLYWHNLWLAFYDYKRDRIFSAIPTTELPDLETLRPSELEAVVEAERDCVMRERATWLNDPSAAHPQKFSTTFGEIRRHTFQPQVLTLFLATQSKVEVAPELMRRRVVLLAGEIGIYLDACLYWPLEIEIDGIQFIATEGVFEVRRYSSYQIEFSVSSGAVHMRCPPDASLPPGLRDVSQACVMGHKIQVTSDGAVVVPLPSGYPGTVLSWRDGKTFWFDRTALEEVVAQYNRYRNELLEIVDRDLADVRITGRYPIGNVQVLLDHLCKDHGIQAKRVTRLSGIAHFICLSRLTPASA